MNIRKGRSLTAVFAALLLTVSSVSCGKVENVGKIESEGNTGLAAEDASQQSSMTAPATEAATEPLSEDKVVYVRQEII